MTPVVAVDRPPSFGIVSLCLVFGDIRLAVICSLGPDLPGVRVYLLRRSSAFVCQIAMALWRHRGIPPLVQRPSRRLPTGLPTGGAAATARHCRAERLGPRSQLFGVRLTSPPRSCRSPSRAPKNASTAALAASIRRRRGRCRSGPDARPPILGATARSPRRAPTSRPSRDRGTRRPPASGIRRRNERRGTPSAGPPGARSGPPELRPTPMRRPTSSPFSSFWLLHLALFILGSSNPALVASRAFTISRTLYGTR